MFPLQKWAIGLVTKSSFSDPFRQHFRRMKILLLPSLYIFRYLLLVHSNSGKFYGYNYFHFHFTRNSFILQYTKFIEPFWKRVHGILVRKCSITCPTTLEKSYLSLLKDQVFETFCLQFILDVNSMRHQSESAQCCQSKQSLLRHRSPALYTALSSNYLFIHSHKENFSSRF